MKNTIGNYLDMDNEMLYCLIGDAAAEEQGLRGFESIKDKLERGKKIFDEYQKQFRTLICSNKKLLQTLQSEEVNTSLNVASLIIPLISNLVIPGTAVLVAALLVKYGIVKYCEIR